MSDQTRVAEFVARHRLQAAPIVRVLDLVSEIGELAKELLKGSAYGQKSLELTASWPEELGDVYFALLCLADSTGVDTSAVLDKVLQKYEARLVRYGNPGSGR